jgi:light-regulated signal transduction histidine kinase (bacteriophytochrome)
MSTDTQAARIAHLERQVASLTEQHAAALRELEAFSYAVSHDLRAPLRSLSGFSQALFESSDANDTKTRHYLERIQQASRRMSDLIDALLTLSRVSRAELYSRDVDLSQLCLEAGNAVKAADPARDISIRIEPGLRAQADPRQLRAAIDALLSNAVKFSAKRSNTVVEIGRTSDGAFFVKDNGAGFDMAYVDKLFKPFQRLHAESDYPGIGIGLALVQRIVARHNGRCWMASDRNGTTAFFTLNDPAQHGRPIAG